MARSKKEIDKELMYKKLMPTAQTDTEPAESAEAQESSPPPAEQAPDVLPVMSKPSPAVVTPPAAASAPVVSPISALASPLTDSANAPISSAAAAIVSGSAPEPQEEIINVMELLVNARIDAAMEKFRCCNCDKCRKDVTAITLNKLLPCYIVSSDNAKRIEIETKYAGQVATALVQAILTVKARPTHE